MPDIIIELGNWKAILYPSTYETKKLVQHMANLFPGFLIRVDQKKKYNQVLFALGPNTLENQNFPAPQSLSLVNRPFWNSFYKEIVKAYQQYSYLSHFKESTGVDSPNRFSFSWFPENNNQGDTIFYAYQLETGDQFQILLLYCLLLATRWHLLNKGICLHSSGVAQGKRGFLFLGESEAGKTTVARLSTSTGYPSLGDDLNFILRNGNDGYLLAAAPSPIRSPIGYSMLRPSLRGVFRLVQDERDALIPLSTPDLARALFKSFVSETPYTNRLPSELIGEAFHTCCEIARQVPGYVLHFRKSPDFWNLIDAEFPVD